MRQEMQREIDARHRQPPGAAPSIFSSALFAGGNEVVITHGCETYRLRETRQGKLILTK
jgi:hemin uptake protein HemP